MNRRFAIVVALLAVGASSLALWTAHRSQVNAVIPPALVACVAPTCVNEPVEGIEPRGADPRKNDPTRAPALDWRTLLPAGIFRLR